MFDFDKFMRHIYSPGHVVAYTGVMGKGKTHLAVAMNEWNIKNRPECYLLTNVIFLKATGKQEIVLRDGTVREQLDWEVEYPEGVIHVRTLEEVFRKTGEILMDHPDAVILILLDEAQNFLLADITEKLALTFFRYIGNARKFRHSVQFITPSLANIPKRIRKMHDNPNYSGYLYAHFFKGQYEVQEYNQLAGTDFDMKEISLLKLSYDQIYPNPMTVPVTEWARPWDMVNTGDIIFDHWASAMFQLGSFDFEELIKKVGGVAHMEAATAILDYFDEQESIQDKLDDPEYRRALRVYRMREHADLTWEDISLIEQTPRQTLYSQMKRHMPDIEQEATA